MAIRNAPKREQQLDDVYTCKPPTGTPPEVVGIRAFVFWRISKGDDVADLSKRFLNDNSIDVPTPTLYKWIKRWKTEETAMKATRQGRKRGRQTEEAAEPERAAA